MGQQEHTCISDTEKKFNGQHCFWKELPWRQLTTYAVHSTSNATIQELVCYMNYPQNHRTVKIGVDDITTCCNEDSKESHEAENSYVCCFLTFMTFDNGI